MVSAADGHCLGIFLYLQFFPQQKKIPTLVTSFLDRSYYYFFQVAPELYSRGRVDPVPDPLLLRKFGSAGNRTWDPYICNQKL
jgi:hypothetical protein